MGIIRKLCDATLRKDSQSGIWFIDLAKERGAHKTAHIYGPAQTRLSDMTVPYLERLFQLREEAGLDFEDEDAVENRTSRRYVFHTAPHNPTRCLSESQWGRWCKSVYAKYSPRGTAPAPKELRSIFITTLRNSGKADAEIKKSCAHMMKHAERTSASDTYDAQVHERLSAAATRFCEEYAQDWLKKKRGVAAEEQDEEPGIDVDTAAGDSCYSPPIHPAAHQSSSRSPSEGTIDAIVAATLLENGSVEFHIMWEGHPNLQNWQQELEEQVAIETLKGVEPFAGRVLELQDASGEKQLCVVAGYDAENQAHDLHLANGTAAQLKLHSCDLLQGDTTSKLSWRVVDFTTNAGGAARVVHYTDASIDWTPTELERAKTNWDDGGCFPEFNDACIVIRALQQQQVMTMEDAPVLCATLARLCEWLTNACPAAQLMLARIDAEKLMPSFLRGSLINDSLRVIQGIEERDLLRIKRQKRTHNTTLADLGA